MLFMRPHNHASISAQAACATLKATTLSFIPHNHFAQNATLHLFMFMSPKTYPLPTITQPLPPIYAPAAPAPHPPHTLCVLLSAQQASAYTPTLTLPYEAVHTASLPDRRLPLLRPGLTAARPMCPLPALVPALPKRPNVPCAPCLHLHLEGAS